jgi:F-type H+-transporting ATPase subunit b
MSLSRTTRASLAAAMLFALSSLPVWAEEAGAGGGGGLPQFDTSYFPEQIFWLIVSVAVLYPLMAFVALPRIERTQGNRRDVIAQEIETARAANEAAKISVAETEKSLNEAREKAQARVSEMLAEVAEEAAKRHSVQEKDLLRKLHTAEEDIATSRTAALGEIRASAADFAKAVVDKILDVKKRVKA